MVEINYIYIYIYCWLESIFLFRGSHGNFDISPHIGPMSLIFVPPHKTTMATSKSFSSVASNIWNSLPNHFSSIPTLPAFRRALKHHLFLLAYPDSAKSGRGPLHNYVTPKSAVFYPPTHHVTIINL